MVTIPSCLSPQELEKPAAVSQRMKGGGGTGGGDSGGAEQSGPPVPTEMRQPRGERPEHSCVPTQLPASVSPPAPWSLVWGTSLHLAPPSTGPQDAELSSFAVAGLDPAPSQQRQADANQPPGPPVSGAGPGGDRGWGSNPAQPLLWGSSPKWLPRDGDSWGVAISSLHGVPCRAEPWRGHQPAPPSPGPTCRNQVRGPCAMGG